MINGLLLIVFDVRKLSASFRYCLIGQVAILPPLSAGLTTKSFIALICSSVVMSSGVILFVLGVGCLYNLVMSVSTFLKCLLRV